MTISSTTNRNDYIGNGSTSVYSYSFKIFSESDLLVTTRTSAGVEATLVLTTDYTVTGVGETSGGSITLVAGNLASGTTLTIRRVRDLTQEADIRNQGDFYPEGHENAFDHLIMVDQQQQDEIDRSVKFPETVSSSDFDPTLPTDLLGEDGLTIITNPAGDGFIAGPSAAGISGAAASAAAAAASAAAAAASAAQVATYSGTNSPYNINNLGLGAAVAANALTISVTQSDGSTVPSTGSSAAMVWFRSATVTNGGFYQRLIETATTVVVPSGATLGHNDALADYIYVYALDNAGTVELAVSSSSHWDEGSVQSTTAIGTGSDDSATLYSTTARSNVAIRLIGRMLSNQTTAGAYAAAITRVEPGFLGVRLQNPFTRAANFQPKHGGLYSVSTASARSLQLPVPRSGWFVDIKDSTNQSSSNAITLVRNGSESIDGVAANKTLTSNGGSWRVYSDGTNFFTMFSSTSSASAFANYIGATNTSETIPTSFASMTIASTVLELGGVSRSGNAITISSAGYYKGIFTIGRLSTMSSPKQCMARIRNTTSGTTKAVSCASSITIDTTGGEETSTYVMSFQVTSGEAGNTFEFQLCATAGSAAINSASTIDGEDSPTFAIVLESIVGI